MGRNYWRRAFWSVRVPEALKLTSTKERPRGMARRGTIIAIEDGWIHA